MQSAAAGLRCQPVRRAEGYTERSGLVHVAFGTQVRTPKASYDWYRDLISRQRRCLEVADEPR